MSTTPTEAFARLALLVFLVLNAAIGIRLIVLSFRTRQLPELALGLGHLLGGALGWALVLGGYVLLVALKMPSGLAIAMGGMFCLNVGCAAGALFAWRVFNPHSRLVMGLYALLVGVLLIDFVHNGLIIHNFAPPADTFWFWPGCLARNTTYLWMAIVTGWYYRKLRKRMVLGLADPTATNRMFLIFLSTAMIVLLGLVTTVGSIFSLWNSHPNLMYSLGSLLGMPSVLSSALAFLPPRRYLAWVVRRAEAE